MRKLLLCAIVMAMSVVSNAQTLQKVFTASDEKFIQKPFSYDGKTGIIDMTDDNVVSLYNSDFEFVRSFTLNKAYGDVEYLDIRDFDDYAYNGKRIMFTQTLFNTDEKIEYLVCSEDGDHNAEYRIMSEDGRTLLTISGAGRLRNVYKIDNKCYMTFGNDNGMVFYRIDTQATGVGQMQATPVSARSIHSLDGRKQSAMQRGVNVVRDEDGTTRKVLKN